VPVPAPVPVSMSVLRFVLAVLVMPMDALVLKPPPCVPRPGALATRAFAAAAAAVIAVRSADAALPGAALPVVSDQRLGSTLLVAAVADSKAEAAATSFQGVFKDPKHPNGYRILVGDAGNKGMMTLQDEPDGMIYSIPIMSKTSEKTGQVSLTIDFSVKGGPKDVVAILNKDSSISFPDGNLWTKEGGVVGVYSDGFNPDRLRIIRAEKGDALVLDLIRGPNGDKRVSGKIVKPDVTFDFPGKPGDKGVVDSTKGTISFADGNVWTKF